MSIIREFEDLGQFALHLEGLGRVVRREQERGLKAALQVIENDAKAQIGHYQPEVGDFPEWAPLAESTEAEKARVGAPADAPLLRHGGLYASFEHEVLAPDDGVVGSTDPTMIYHELGTSKMPPRPVMGPAAIRSRERIQQILGQAIVQGILGGNVLPGGKDYFGGDVEP